MLPARRLQDHVTEVRAQPAGLLGTLGKRLSSTCPLARAPCSPPSSFCESSPFPEHLLGARSRANSQGDPAPFPRQPAPTRYLQKLVPGFVGEEVEVSAV